LGSAVLYRVLVAGRERVLGADDSMGVGEMKSRTDYDFDTVFTAILQIKQQQAHILAMLTRLFAILMLEEPPPEKEWPDA
jgi:hypothetical protein